MRTVLIILALVLLLVMAFSLFGGTRRVRRRTVVERPVARREVVEEVPVRERVVEERPTTTRRVEE